MSPKDPSGAGGGLGLNPCKLPPKGWLCTRIGGHDGPCAAVPAGEAIVYDTPTAGPKMTWNADGLHIEDPRLKDRPETVGGLKGCYTIDWDTIDRMRARFAPAKEV